MITYIHIYEYTYIYTYVKISIHVCKNIYVLTYTNTYIFIYVHTCFHIPIKKTNIDTSIKKTNIDTHIYMYMYICIFIIHTYVFTSRLSTHSASHASFSHMGVVVWGLAMCVNQAWLAEWRGGVLGSSTIFKNLMSPMPRLKWYLTTGRRTY